MKIHALLLPLLLCGFGQCSAQQLDEKLIYQLAEDVMVDLPPPILHAKRGQDGKYHWYQPTPAETPALLLLLLDRSGLPDEANQFVLPGLTTNERTQAQRYFSARDLAYMRQQLPASKQFRFEQAKLRDSWVKIVHLDTIQALRKRLGWQGEFLLSDSLIRRYGSQNTFCIWGALFSINHQRALVSSSSYDGWATYVYKKVGPIWRREAVLRQVCE